MSFVGWTYALANTARHAPNRSHPRRVRARGHWPSRGPIRTLFPGEQREHARQRQRGWRRRRHVAGETCLRDGHSSVGPSHRRTGGMADPRDGLAQRLASRMADTARNVTVMRAASSGSSWDDTLTTTSCHDRGCLSGRSVMVLGAVKGRAHARAASGFHPLTAPST
jgi:hypothetical protein